MKRRTVLGLGVGLASVGAVSGLGALGMHYAAPYTPARALPHGKLTCQPVEVRFGAYWIRLDEGQFRLFHGSDEIWSSGGPFLYAGRGHKQWREQFGYFSAKTELDEVFVDQLVDAVTTNGEQATITGTLRASNKSNKSIFYTLTFIPDAYGLTLELSVPNTSFTGLCLSLGGDESVHGAGEQFTNFDLRGFAFHLLPREQGIGRGRQPITLLAEVSNGAGGSPTTTYAPLPFLITSAMRTLTWSNDEVAEVDLREEKRLDLRVWSSEIHAYLENAGDPATLVRSHTRRTGRMKGLPDWTGRGAILGLQGGTEVVRKKIASLKQEKAAIAGVWLPDWAGVRDTDLGSRSWWTWELDTKLYPGWNEFVSELIRDNILTLSYVNPFVVDPRTKPDPVRRNLFEEGVQNSFFVRTKTGSPYLLDQGGFDAAMVDLTNPAARAWFSEVIASQVGTAGTGGWMADAGESLPFDAVLHSGSPDQWHNRWPTAWAELNAEVRDRLGGASRLVFHRSAWRGTLTYANAFWAGDQLVDWDDEDGMANALKGILAGGLSGLAINHSDIGGYTSFDRRLVSVRRTSELLARWAEWSAWTPLFRTQEGDRPAGQVQVYDEENRAAFAAQSRVFAALYEYRKEVLAQAASDGLPALRYCWLHYPNDDVGSRLDQFFYGDRFLVAPIFAPGARGRDVCFPPGNWTNVWTGKTFAGNQTGSVRAPMGQTGVFYRSDDRVASAIAGEVRRAAL